jgi:hypothetical protein
MEIGVPNSFIPHDATTPVQSRRYDSSGGLTDLFALLSVVVFIASGALAAGVFLFGQYINTEVTSKKDAIKTAQQAFDPSLVQQLTRLDQRMSSASTILNAHIAPSAFFSVLNQTTLTTVSFQSLEFRAGDPQGITLKMSGVARDVNSIALQADIFSKSGVITSPIFSGIDQQTDGVHFNVVGLINPAALNYETLVSGRVPAGVNQLPPGASTVPSQAPNTSTTTAPHNTPSVAPVTLQVPASGTSQQ